MKKAIRVLLTSVLFISLGIIAGMIIFARINKPDAGPFEMASIQAMPNAKGVIERIKVKDVLVESVSGKSELVTMQSDLVQQLQMDQSVTDWGIFKKTQDLAFYGTCKYSTDLSAFTADDINFLSGKAIEITVPGPVISSLEINEDETYINNTENGLLRFGEIKLTAFDENEIRKTVKDRMLKEAESPEYIEMAEKKTAEAVGELFGELLNAAGFSGYEISVVFR